jgi:hypothetical protein
VKITFEGETLLDIFSDMERALNDAEFLPRHKPAPETLRSTAQREVKEVLQKIEQRLPADRATIVDRPVSNPVEKRGRTEKQLANDERLRERAQAKKAAGLKPFDKMPKAAAPTPVEVPPADPVDPAEVVRIRQKTITDLQEAYANGHQQEVFELLSRFGNGAKSFRELPPEAFLPISQAIAKGALT